MQRLSGFLSLLCLVTSCGSSASPTASPPADDDPPASIPVPPPADDDAAAPAQPTDAGPVVGNNVVRFIAVGDTGTGEDAQQKVGNTMAAFCKQRGCDFIQLLGDNLYETGASSVDDPIWKTAFETPYAAIDLDFWVVLGNHDYGSFGLGLEFGKGKNEVDYSAKSPKWKLPSASWHKAPPTGNGRVEIFGLDTNMIAFDLAADQKKNFPEWIAASTADWKIAVGHHPYKSNGSHGNAGSYEGSPFPPVNGASVKSFLESTICGKVDLYLSGHDHSRQWLGESCSGTELAISGAGAKTTELGGKNAALFESLGLGFLYVVIDGKTLTAEFVDEDGKTEFTHSIQKP